MMNALSGSFKKVNGRYKKWIAIALVSGFVMITLSFGAIGFVIYKVANFASDKIQNAPTVALSVATELPEPGFVEGVVFGVARGWIEESLASGEVTAFKNGLACFDTIGGPSPSEVVNYLKSRLSDSGIASQLDVISRSIDMSGMPASGSQACVTWILSS